MAFNAKKYVTKVYSVAESEVWRCEIIKNNAMRNILATCVCVCACACACACVYVCGVYQIVLVLCTIAVLIKKHSSKV